MGLTALHTMDEVAIRLRVSRRWLQDFIKHHPYYRRVGRKKLSTEEDIARLIEALPCPGNSCHRVKARRRTGPSAGSISESLWTTARELLRNEPRKQSSTRGSDK